MEYHRNGYALVAEPDSGYAGATLLIRHYEHREDLRLCYCTTKYETCDHIKRLAELYRLVNDKSQKSKAYDLFRDGFWSRLAKIMADECMHKIEKVKAFLSETDNGSIVIVTDSKGVEIFRYLSQDDDKFRFLNRVSPSGKSEKEPNRYDLLDRLLTMTMTESEQDMLDRGYYTNRLSFERSFWHRMAYHCHREYKKDDVAFHPAIDETTGDFTVSCVYADYSPVFRMVVPRSSVRAILKLFSGDLPNQHGLTIHPVPLKSLFKVSMNTSLDLEVMPVIRALQKGGEARYIERQDIERFRYGDLVYVKELKILAELEKPGGMERKFKSPVKMTLKNSQIPSFFDDHKLEIEKGEVLLDSSVQSTKIIKDFGKMTISLDAIERDWMWLSVRYGIGNISISLHDILQARNEGQRYIATGEGWVDCQSPALDWLDRAVCDRSNGDRSGVKLSRLELMRLSSTCENVRNDTRDAQKADILKKLLELTPATPMNNIAHMKSDLRHYQKIGIDWLRFLYDNGFGGLLCDDMGLGKTHQIMALMAALRFHYKIAEPMLVVCPTSVMSHWSHKISAHIDSVKPAIFHGYKRELAKLLKTSDILITSYGVLRIDIAELKDVRFALAAFDEAHQIKNAQTVSYDAANAINAGMKICLTGTPIENRLSELKSLMDLAIPGYLGNDKYFTEKFANRIEVENRDDARKDLARIISPFILRRLKKTVLDELPEKIEDIRTCELSDDQVKLYRDAISAKGKDLAEILKQGQEPVPYMHIFALLNLLKRICDHPALVNGDANDYEKHQSGKWELFRELVSESLESGQKVIVFSQYLGMIGIMEKYFTAQNIGYVSLTGASRNRGEIIRRFNEDENCRVFIGSLKAGGVGIDLVAGSVVIHYDRWWNAAKEDQATDRAYRIGQKRCVQVFKLVTEGTLEEKISAIIEKKRNLMDSVIKEDAADSLKAFSREELAELLVYQA